MSYSYKNLVELFNSDKDFKVNTLSCLFLQDVHQKLIYSYSTIIAVIDTNSNNCYIVDKKYSATTSKQQGLLRRLQGTAFNNVYTVSMDKILEKFTNLSIEDFAMNKVYDYGEFLGR